MHIDHNWCGIDLRIDNVGDTIGDENVRNDHLGVVDENLTIDNRDSHIFSLEGLESRVLENAAVPDRSSDDVVLEHVLEIVLAQVGEDGSDGGEGSVGGDEDGDVLGLTEVADEVGLGQSTGCGGEVGGDGGVGQVLGDLQKAVDDVDNTAGEVEILGYISVSSHIVQTKTLTAVVTLD